MGFPTSTIIAPITNSVDDGVDDGNCGSHIIPMHDKSNPLLRGLVRLVVRASIVHSSIIMQQLSSHMFLNPPSCPFPLPYL